MVKGVVWLEYVTVNIVVEALNVADHHRSLGEENPLYCLRRWEGQNR